MKDFLKEQIRGAFGSGFLIGGAHALKGTDAKELEVEFERIASQIWISFEKTYNDKLELQQLRAGIRQVDSLKQEALSMNVTGMTPIEVMGLSALNKLAGGKAKKVSK